MTQTTSKWVARTALIFILLAATLYTPVVTAQSGAGSIEGTVQDATHAAIPRATITVVNRATGVMTATKSNRVGFYQVPGLFVGTYAVTISAPNMKTYETSIQLLVAQNAVINPVLTPGAVTQQVVVSGNTVQLTDTVDGTISSTLENARINQLPENGRLLTTLIQMTTPGIENGGLRANGLMRSGLDYVADGVQTAILSAGGEYQSQAQLPDPDSVQEVQVQTSDSSAEYAAPSTAVVTTKSGTNSLHGTAFETARNNGIGIAKNRNNPSNFSAPQYIRNEFGVSAGGPIILPHVYHGKDKSFWFLAYERYSLAQDSNMESRVPTMAMRQGDFSGLYNGQGILQTVFDPATTKAAPSLCAFTNKTQTFCRTPFPGNVIPLGEESPTTKILYDLTPQPTSNDNPLVSNNLNVLAKNFDLLPQVTFRLDHEFNQNNRVYARFSDIDNSTFLHAVAPESLAADGIPAGVARGIQYTPAQTFLASLGYTHVFSPTFYAETVLAQQWLSNGTTTGVDPNVNWESKLGLPNNFGEPGFPGIAGIIFGLTTSQNSSRGSQLISDIEENMTKIVGRNQLHFGGRFQHERDSNLPAGPTDGISFATTSTGIYNASTGANYGVAPNTGYGDASFFLGSVSNYTIQTKTPHDHYHLNEIDAYLQDDYQVSRTLTLNLGLRYEAHPATWTKYGIVNAFDYKNDAMVLAIPPSQLIAEGYTTQAIITNDENIGVKFETPSEAGMPATTLMRNYYLNFLPRAGIAYQPFGGKYGTVIRGAYGRYIYPEPLQDYANQTEKNNPLLATFSQNYAAANQAIDGFPNELLRYNDPVQFGVMGVNQSNAVNSNTTNSILPGINTFSPSPNSAPSAVTETNFTVEQPLKGNSVLRVSWVWTHATNLDIDYYPNNHPSAFQWEMAHGVVPPTGGASVIGTQQQNTYAATATGPYDQTTWGGGQEVRLTSGWSNDNALQVNYQRLFHHGFAYQISWVFSKALAAGGDSSPNTNSQAVGGVPYANYPGALGTVATMTSPYGTLGPLNSWTPPPPPAGTPIWANYHALNTWEEYGLDPTIPYHHIEFNGIVDMPFGRGKRFFGNANRFLNEIIGGFQVAGDGNITTQVMGVPTSFGPVSPLKIYKHKYPIVDCRSGNCYKAYMWFNGYLPPTVTTGVAGSVCTQNCITGLPADYVPLQTPIDNTPGTTYFGKNEVQITAPGINSGKPTDIAYDAGPGGEEYYARQYLNGPVNWNADASIFKVFPITERVNLRVNMDAFNVFNRQGYTNPGADGVEEVQPGVGQATSYNTPRQIQLTMRLTF
jgi:hypothetical protein